MTNTNQQFNFLDNINFVRDLTSETAANYSGGCGSSDRGVEDFQNLSSNNAIPATSFFNLERDVPLSMREDFIRTNREQPFLNL